MEVICHDDSILSCSYYDNDMGKKMGGRIKGRKRAEIRKNYEELVILLSNLDEKTLIRIYERLRKNANDTPRSNLGQEF